MALPLLHFAPSLFSSYSSSSSSNKPSTSRLPQLKPPLLLHQSSRRCSRRLSSVFTSQCSSPAAAPPHTADEVPAGPKTRLIAQNLPWSCTVEDVKQLFQKYGTVEDVELSMYNKTRNRGLAFIAMASEEEALAALTNLNSYDLDGRTIKVEFSRSLKKRPSVPTPKYNVFVGNLAWSVRSKDIREIFYSNWNVLSAEVIFQGNPRRSAGYGFVSFASKEEAEAAISAFNGKRLMGRPIRMFLGKESEEGAELRSDMSETAEIEN